MTNPPIREKLTQNTGAILFVLLLVDSLHLVFAAVLRPYFPAVTAGFLVLVIATAEVWLFLTWRRQVNWRVLTDNLPFFLVVGGLVGGATWMSYLSVRFVDPGTAALLSRSSTIFTIGLGLLWLKDRLSRQEWLGTAVALVGVGIISFQPGDYLRIGSLIVLGSSFLYALHAAVVKRYGDEIEFTNFFLFRVMATSFAMFLMVWQQDAFVGPTEPIGWVYAAAAGTIDVVISRVLYYWSLRKLTVSYHAIVLMMSPVVTILWSLLFFQEFPTVRALIGGALVLAGLVIVSLYRNRPQTTDVRQGMGDKRQES